MPDNYQLSTQIDDLYQRLSALEAQVALLSNRLGVPYTSSASGAVFDPRLATAPDPRAMGTGFDPLAPVPPPAPDSPFAPPPAADAQPVSMPADPLVAGLTAEIMDLVRRGKKIQAIKLYREQTNVDLKTAKNVIDHL
jgi:hypothetical protein